MATHSTPKFKDLSPIYLESGTVHPREQMIFTHFNAIHNTLVATGSSAYASGHNAASYLDDHCVGSASPIRSWRVADDGALVIDNSQLGLNQSTIQGFRAEDFPEWQQQNFRRFLNLIEERLATTHDSTGTPWSDVANSFSIGGIARHRHFSSIRALLDFAGHLSPGEELEINDDCYEASFYYWGEQFGDSMDAADMAVWDEIRAAWYCYFNIVDPKTQPAMVKKREPTRIEVWKMVSRVRRFPKRATDSHLMEDMESESECEETDSDEDDKDMMVLQRGMEKFED